MNRTGTIDDAAAVFSALQGDQVIALLSRLETDDAQRLLVTAAKLKSTADDIERATSLLSSQLNQHSTTTSNQPPAENHDRKQSLQRDLESDSCRSLDFLIDLTDHDIRVLLSKVSTACWAPALKSESNAVRGLVFSNVAPTIKRILKQEIAAFDGSEKVAQASREKIINAAHDLQPSATRTTRKKAG